MHITAVGISHKTAPIDIREKFYLDETRRRLLLSELKNNPAVVEAIVLSTCNRTEIYAHTIAPAVTELLLQSLFKVKSIPFSCAAAEESTKYFYTHQDRDAVFHLLRVASGLESVVLGENQILGQVKTAVDSAREEGMLARTFNVLAAVAIRAGKKARHETMVGSGGVSVSWAAVNAAQRLAGTLKGRSVLIIGAGKMANLAANQLVNRALGELYIMNRSQDNAEGLAEKFGGISVSFWDMKEILRRVDVCICSSGAPHYVLEKDVVQQTMAGRPQRPLVCVDISIPRNIDPAAGQVAGVSLITVDDLGDIVTETMQRRNGALSQVDGIVNQKVDEFYSKIARSGEVKAAAA
ncbi:MAG: glutamyl-tRNA reductase [Candidatus Omnitrophica bacterium]|nr:glutamyl-tRNA reductase [Candidatus Omnitrophota bacterium]